MTDFYADGRVPKITTTELINSSLKYTGDHTVITAGFLSSIDGGSGVWVQNDVTGQVPSQSPIDLDAPLLNDLNGNQYKIIDENGINLYAFGAIGDGVADDTEAVEVAFNSGLRITPTDGVYICDRARVTNTCNIVGSGRGAVFKQKSKTLLGASAAVIEIEGLTEKSLISNITIDGNKAGISDGDALNCEGFNVKNCDNLHFTNIYGFNVKSELIDWDDSSDCSATNITGVDCGGLAIHISTNCTRVSSIDSFAIRCGITNTRSGFDMHSSTSKCAIVNCFTFECHFGFTINGTDNRVTGFTAINSADIAVNILGTDCLVTDVVADGAALAVGATFGGARVSGTGNSVSNIKLSNVDKGRGLEIDGDDNDISNFTVDGVDGTGIATTTGSSGNSLSNCKSKNASNAFFLQGTRNTLDRCKAVDASSDGFILSSDGIEVTGCTAENSTGDGFQVDGADCYLFDCNSDVSGAAGYRIAATADDTKVISCRANGFGSVRITDLGPSTIIKGGDSTLGGEQNLEYTINTGGGSIEFTIPHDLGITPLGASVTALSEEASGDFWISDMTAPQIKVKYKTSPPAGDLVWNVKLSAAKN